jgi:hypothetical protein
MVLSRDSFVNFQVTSVAPASATSTAGFWVDVSLLFFDYFLNLFKLFNIFEVSHLRLVTRDGISGKNCGYMVS